MDNLNISLNQDEKQELKRKKDRQYYLKNKDKIKNRSKEYRENNKEKNAIYKAKHAQQNKTKIKEYN